MKSVKLRSEAWPEVLNSINSKEKSDLGSSYIYKDFGAERQIEISKQQYRNESGNLTIFFWISNHKHISDEIKRVHGKERGAVLITRGVVLITRGAEPPYCFDKCLAPFEHQNTWNSYQTFFRSNITAWFQLTTTAVMVGQKLLWQCSFHWLQPLLICCYY